MFRQMVSWGGVLHPTVPLLASALILRNTHKKKFSKWRHQTISTNFLVFTRPKCLLFSNKRKRVRIGQNANLNQGDTPLNEILKYNSGIYISQMCHDRGYLVTQDELDQTIEQFIDHFGDKPRYSTGHS